MPWLGYSLLVLDPLVQISAPDQVRKGYQNIRLVFWHTERSNTVFYLIFEEGWVPLTYLTACRKGSLR